MTKSKITAEQVQRLGELAKLNIDPAEEDNLREELSAVLEYFDLVDKVAGEAGDDHAMPPRMRPDEVQPSEPTAVMKGVPQRKGRLVKAPRVF